MTFRKLMLSVAAITAIYANPAMSAPSCANSEEIQALNTRILQTDLMVAAISCHQQAEYNGFVKRYQAQLVNRGKSLQSYFSRAYGGSGTNKLNRFVTQVANDSSQQSLNIPSQEFCAQAAQVFSRLEGMKPAQLSSVTSEPQFALRHGIEPCDAMETAGR